MILMSSMRINDLTILTSSCKVPKLWCDPVAGNF